ncbi:MAG: Brp/Blh family beta-carotene 15,15'-dioxygenase [Halalkalicoccus sp.]
MARRTAVTPAASGTVRRLAFLVPWVVLGTATLVVSALGAPAREYQLLVFAVSVVILGLPHGALDHLAPARAAGDVPTRRWFALVGALYLAVGLAYALVWWVAPAFAFASFIAITWFHWGQDDLHALVTLAGPSHLQTVSQRALSVAARGALPMLVPLVAFPGEYRLVAETLVGLFAEPDLGIGAVAFTPAGRAVVAGVVLALLVGSLATSYSRARRRAWALDAGETGLLVAYFLLVPPILAVGVYFCFWHALRHVVRLLLVDPVGRERLAGGRTSRALARFVREATPLTAGALCLIGLLGLALSVSPTGPSDLFGLYLVGIALLTAPHVLVVGWMDRAEGIWTPGE